MGYETGSFQDRDGNKFHIEASSHLVIIHYPDERKSLVVLEPEEAVKLTEALNFALMYYKLNPYD